MIRNSIPKQDSKDADACMQATCCRIEYSIVVSYAGNTMSSQTTKSIEELRKRIADVVDLDGCVLGVARQDALEVTSVGRSGHRIEIRIRDCADFEVAYVVPGKPGSPFEQVIAGPREDSPAILQSVVDFVDDLVQERIVLGWDARMFGGGRRFLKTTDMDATARSRFEWVVSWRGSYDWPKSG